MFKIDDLKSKVSEFKLGDIIEMGATEDDYHIPTDYEEHEIKTPVSVRLNDEILRASRTIMSKYKCSSNMLYKSATKLGAIVMNESKEIKVLEDICWVFDTMFDRSQELNDDYMIGIIYEFTEKIAETSNMFKFGKNVSVKKIYPYPKWRAILNKHSYTLSTTVSNVYRMAIVLAFSTELSLKSAKELYRSIFIIQRKRLATLHDFCNVAKNSASFIKFDYANYINIRLKKKELSDEVRKIVEEVLLDDNR